MIPIDLTGKTAVVTGSSQGLGRATAELLHRAGANVVINDIDANAAKTAEVAAALGDRGLHHMADVRDLAAMEAMAGRVIERFGSFDILVNNAGILRDKTAKKMLPEDWQAVIDTNLTGVFHGCKAAVGKMAAGGRIVNLASISAAIGFFGQANYAAAKAGVIGLTKVLSKELASRQITVNAVAPGVVLTDMGKSIPEESRKVMLGQIPLNRFGTPEEIAQVILFLCSPLASYMTGQTLHVNGGWWG